jgi:hypothetical protein
VDLCSTLRVHSGECSQHSCSRRNFDFHCKCNKLNHIPHQPRQPLLIELVAADNTIVGVRQVFIKPDPAGGHILFTADVIYKVDSPTWVRLTLSQSGARIPGVSILNSLEVLLS